MKSKLILITAVAIAVSVISCKKDAGPTGPAGTPGPNGPVLTGNLKGYINHFDVGGSKIASNLAGDSVTIDGTNKVSITDTAGYFSFTGLTTGMYNLTIKRNGFGINKVQSLQFTGGGDLFRNSNISTIPTTTLSSFLAKDTAINGINYIRLKGTIASSNNIQTVIVYAGIPGNPTVGPGVSNQIDFYTINVNPGVTTFNKNIPTQDFYDLGYASTNTAYFAANTVGGNTNASSYVDLATNKTIFTALGSVFLLANAPIQ